MDSRRKPVYGSRWAESCLERSGRKGEETYLKALSRQLIWSPVKLKFHPQDDPSPSMDFHEAFVNMGNSLRKISEDCQKYHTHKGGECKNSVHHCHSYHSPKHIQIPERATPFAREDVVHISLPKGGYAVTCHSAKTSRTEVEKVTLADGSQICLHFNT